MLFDSPLKKIINFLFRFERLGWKIKILLYKCVYRGNVKIGKIFVRENFRIMIEKQGHISIGNNVFFNGGCSINCLNSVVIGNNCLFGENVKIYDHNHRFRRSDIPIAQQDFSTEAVSIGNNCWIGSNVTILKGTKIGNHVVIGANCVIDRDIPADTIVKMNNNYNLIPMEKSNV